MKYIKTYENRHKYQIGDFVIIKKKMWNLSTKSETYVNMLVYITYLSDVPKHENMYMGLILPSKKEDDEIYFNEDSILEKIPPEEAKLYIDSNKYNL